MTGTRPRRYVETRLIPHFSIAAEYHIMRVAGGAWKISENCYIGIFYYYCKFLRRLAHSAISAFQEAINLSICRNWSGRLLQSLTPPYEKHVYFNERFSHLFAGA